MRRASAPPAFLSRALLTLALSASLAGCTKEDILGEDEESQPLAKKDSSWIPSGAFVFGDVVEHDSKDAGGWRSVCLHLRLPRPKDDIDEGMDPEVSCKLELGIPIGSEPTRSLEPG